ncbi:phosphotransferase-like protein [Ceratocystis lukuohia]|uniref:Phosphotransferase-like protein n=1 Tax=Ceratocystis lukuohia TaxID=2019550 RepID=A0ABR4MLJ9_9PEZI
MTASTPPKEKDAEVAEAKARADADKKRAVEKDSLIAEANARADAEKQRAAEKDNQIAKQNALNAKVSLHAYIYYLYAHSFQTLRICPKGPETTAAGSTSVLGYSFPYIKGFCEQLQERKMRAPDGESSGDECVDISSIGADIPEPVTVVFASASRGRRPSLDISNTARNPKRPANSPPDSDGTRSIKAQSPERNIKPDGTCVRITNKSPTLKNLLVIEHKPAHVFTPDLLRSAFENIVDSGSRIFIESADPRASPSTSGDTEEKKSQDHPAGSKLVAKALVQTYHYMVTLGLSYGYISTGQATVLLYINYKEPSELYFRLCIHQKDVSGIPCRGSEDPPARDSQISSALENGIKNTPLPRFHGFKKPPSDPSSGSGKGNERGDAGSSSLRNAYPQLQPPDGRSSGQREQDPSKKHAANVDSYNNCVTYRLPRLEYCSQKCLLGLANGGYLDQSCPNVHIHRKVPVFESFPVSVHEKHQISLFQLVDIVKAQLDTNLDSDCEVQPNKSGLLGIAATKNSAHLQILVDERTLHHACNLSQSNRG